MESELRRGYKNINVLAQVTRAGLASIGKCKKAIALEELAKGEGGDGVLR